MKRYASALLTILYTLTSYPAAYSAETNYWMERRRRPAFSGLKATRGVVLSGLLEKLPSVEPRVISPTVDDRLARDLPVGYLEKNATLFRSLSASYGRVRKVTTPAPGRSGGRTVIHIQDVHQNPDAQSNIGKALQALVDKDQVGLLALEGAFDPIRLEGLRSFSRRDVLRKWADYLLRTSQISGPIHAALTGPKPVPRVVGVDDREHYQANVDAYLASAPNVPEIETDISALISVLDKEKSLHFNKELLAFDRVARSYAMGKTGLSEYFKTMAGLVPSKDLTSECKNFLKAVEMESAMDFQKVENDRVRMVERLVEKLDKGKLDALTRWSLAYRAGQIRYADFYRSLKALCERNGLPLARYPDMDAYVRYVLLADGINAERLMEETAAMEKAVYSRLTETPDQKILVDRSRFLTLAEKLVGFALSPAEYAEYVRAPSVDIPKERLATFEEFYKQAHVRDQSMAANLLREMDAGKVAAAVLVTGGFHSAGVDEQLRRAGVTVISYTPTIEKVDLAGGSAYLSVFSREKTPLEKLFQGQRLFLAQSPVAGLNQAPAALPAGVVAEDALSEMGRSRILYDLGEVVDELNEIFNLSTPISIPAFDVKKNGTTFEVTVSISDGDDTRRVRYTAVLERDGTYTVESVALVDSGGKVIVDERTSAPSNLAKIGQAVSMLAKLSKLNVITESPVMAALGSFSLGSMGWVVNLHAVRNRTLTDFVARIIKLEMLRFYNTAVPRGRITPGLSRNPKLNRIQSDIILTCLGKIAGITALVQFILDYGKDRSLRLGALNFIDGQRVFHPRFGIVTVRHRMSQSMVELQSNSTAIRYVSFARGDVLAGTQEQMEIMDRERVKIVRLHRENYYKFADFINYHEQFALHPYTNSLKENYLPDESAIDVFNEFQEVWKSRQKINQQLRDAIIQQRDGGLVPGLPKDPFQGFTYHQLKWVRMATGQLTSPLQSPMVGKAPPSRAGSRKSHGKSERGLNKYSNVSGELFVQFCRTAIDNETGKVKEEYVERFENEVENYGPLDKVGSPFAIENVKKKIREDMAFLEGIAVIYLQQDFIPPDQVQAVLEGRNQQIADAEQAARDAARARVTARVKEMWTEFRTPIFWQLLGPKYQADFADFKDEWPAVMRDAGIPPEMCRVIPEDEYDQASRMFMFLAPRRQLVRWVETRLKSLDVQGNLSGADLWRIDRISFWALHFNNVNERLVRRRTIRGVVYWDRAQGKGGGEEEHDSTPHNEGQVVGPDILSSRLTPSDDINTFNDLLDGAEMYFLFQHYSSNGPNLRRLIVSTYLLTLRLMSLREALLRWRTNTSTDLEETYLAQASEISSNLTKLGSELWDGFSRGEQETVIRGMRTRLVEIEKQLRALPGIKIPKTGWDKIEKEILAPTPHVKKSDLLGFVLVVFTFAVVWNYLGVDLKGMVPQEALFAAFLLPASLAARITETINRWIKVLMPAGGRDVHSDIVPPVSREDFRVDDIFGPGVDLETKARRIVGGMPSVTRQGVKSPAGAVRWVVNEVLGVTPNSVGLMPLPVELLAREDMDWPEFVEHSLTMHPTALFYVDAGASIPPGLSKALGNRENVRLVEVHPSENGRLFEGNEIKMAVLELNAPRKAPVQAYAPEGFEVNDSGVENMDSFGRNAVRSLNLVVMFQRAVELARFIAKFA